LVESALAAGEGEEGFDQSFLLLTAREQLLAGSPQCLRTGVWVGEGDLEQCALQRERRSEFVGGVGDELALRSEGGFQAAKQLVERVGEMLELVVGALEREASVQVAG
jgi:hypothetical protein